MLELVELQWNEFEFGHELEWSKQIELGFGDLSLPSVSLKEVDLLYLEPTLDWVRSGNWRRKLDAAKLI